MIDTRDPLAIEAIRGFASDAEVRNSTIFGIRMIDLDKDDIIRVSIWVYKKWLDKTTSKKIADSKAVASVEEPND